MFLSKGGLFKINLFLIFFFEFGNFLKFINKNSFPRDSPEVSHYVLRATVCKYRPKSTFCGTSSKFEFRSFLAHR